MTQVDVCPCCRLCEIDPDRAEAPEAQQPDHDSAQHEQSSSHHEDHAGSHGGHGDHGGHEQMFRRRFWVCLVVSLPVLFWSETIQTWFNYQAPEFTGSRLIVPVLATYIFIYGGFPFLQMSSWELRARRPAMMTLISLAIVVAYGFSMVTLLNPSAGDDFFWELVTLIDIMLLGHWMEMRSVRLASGALDALAELLPDTAEMVGPDGSVHSVPAADLNSGDVVLIRPGASVPADGVIVEGDSHFDESMITGESVPVAKTPESEVIGGTVNAGNGAIRARVSATGDDTALAGIMKLVAEAEASKSSTQLLADRAASLLFWAAVGAAAITAVAWTIALSGPSQQMVAAVVTVLVIACPHALGLAIPLVVANTTALAADNGTLIRRREAIDTAKDLDVIAVDKTGTLTEGRIGLTGIVTGGSIGDERALALAAAVEADSEHPMARAVRNAATEKGVDVPVATEFEILKGRGVRATVEDNLVVVGGPRLLESLGLSHEEFDEFTRSSGTRGESVVYLVVDDAVAAAFALADVVRPESRPAIDALHEMGVDVAMLTGDSEQVAAAVSAELGIDRHFAQVLPADKDNHVQELQDEGHMVGMVGDGVNDAPALTRADIGIAIGSGTDVAVQSADLVLVASNPLDIVKILKLSAASYRKQLQNIWWGAGYNIVMIPLAAGVLAPIGFVMPPAVGAVLMSVSTIVVAINAQMLRRVDLSV